MYINTYTDNTGTLTPQNTSDSIDNAIKYIHEKLIEAEGITHLSTIDNQYDLITKAPPFTNITSISFNSKTETKPLYYKFSSNNNTDVYITIVLKLYSQSPPSYPTFPQFIVNINNSFVEYNGYYGNIQNKFTTKNNQVVQSQYVSGTIKNAYYAPPTGADPSGATESIIKTDIEKGILYCFFGLGINYRTAQYSKHAILSIALKVNGDTITFLQDNGNINNTLVHDVSVSSRKCATMSINEKNAYKQIVDNLTCNVKNSNTIMELTYIDAFGDIGVFDGLYVYNYDVLSSIGVFSVDETDIYLLGDGVEAYRIGNSGLMSLAIKMGV